MGEYLWSCPFCGTDQTVTDADRQVSFADLTKENADGPRRLVVKYVVCTNPACRRFTLTASLHTLETTGNRSYTGKHLKSWPLQPPSRAKTFPVSVPVPVLQDYEEACISAEFSPKVAAALARRCLSSMLRDFWQVQPGSLSDEFRQARGAMDPLTWEAIEAVKGRGMIGARMEREGTEILDIDPGEENLLIGLIETLIHDWYVVRDERRKRLHKMREIAGGKAAENPFAEI